MNRQAMPRIFDNIEQKLLCAITETLSQSQRADFSVGYFNLRGWRLIGDSIDALPESDFASCRLLIGMHRSPDAELRAALRIRTPDQGMDQQTASRLRQKAAEEFRKQLVIGAPSNDDEVGLRRLSDQLRSGRLIVKLHLRYPLHAKLYLFHRDDFNNPMTGYLGSSNLTMAGLSQQGELNVDVLDHDSCRKLQRWFDDRWSDRFSLDISEELADIIDESWAREQPVLPYHLYLKMAYHLSQDARDGLTNFQIPQDLQRVLLDYQTAAVKIAAHHLNRRGGVMIGDVVGLGKTLMATALAKIFHEDNGHSTLIICPANLQKMWQEHADRYGLPVRVMSYGMVERNLADVGARFRILIVDESHNLRNREGSRYAAIQEYIRLTQSKVILLTATPYNKHYEDLASQLRLFVNPEADIGIRPEEYLRQITEPIFAQRHQVIPRSLAAFEHSPYADDWRDLMRLYLVRRTRSFIIRNYARTDPENGRTYLPLGDGSRSYFPTRVPLTVRFRSDADDPADVYARLYADEIVNIIDGLYLPRYGLGGYETGVTASRLSSAERKQLENLSKAGKRLTGFARTNLFKRLESGGPAFLQSVDRHILRNYIYLHAIDNGLDLPIGTLEPESLDPGIADSDEHEGVEIDNGEPLLTEIDPSTQSVSSYRRRAAQAYQQFAGPWKKRYKWLRPTLFNADLCRHLEDDAWGLMEVLRVAGSWDPAQDQKLNELERLLTQQHPDEKVIVFTQFADTAIYLAEQLRARGLAGVASVTGDSGNPTELAERFSPVSNGKRHQMSAERELRVLIATDVLSEGQNLQDGHIIVNYDLPWAIIRLIQRAGRVDRIGQQAAEIRCYSFMPADQVEKLLRLRERVVQRLRENAEVIGSDEDFFGDGDDEQTVLDIYNEKAGILDDDAEDDTDLSSRALAIWNNAIAADPKLKSIVERLPDVVYSSRAHDPTATTPEGVLVYMRTAQEYDALAWVGRNGEAVTESQSRILQMADCHPATPATPRHVEHHHLVEIAAERLAAEVSREGGQLGRPNGARYKTYMRLKGYIEANQGTIFLTEDLKRAHEAIYRYPLRNRANETLNRQMRAGIDDQQLAEIVVGLHREDHLSIVQDEDIEDSGPRIICSLGLWRESVS